MKKWKTLCALISAAAALSFTAAANAQASGPDVIVGDLSDFASYAPVGNVAAFAVGTTSCNIGSEQLRWWTSTNRPNAADWNQHPVIGQNLYRYKVVNGAGTFEQIGQSWLKHGFTALQQNLCQTCVSSGTGSFLGVGCSDPYTASLNGGQSRLGPRSDVNAYTGAFPYPFTSPSYSGTIARRLQVAYADLDLTANAGAVYFAEGQYVSPDDAAAGNGFNNVSYRRVNVSFPTSGGNANRYVLTSNGATVRELPAIFGWKAVDSAVTINPVDVPGEGRFYVGYKVTPIAGGRFHYEYAVFNMNSHRSAGSFAINFPASGSTACIDTTNVAMRDVNYHSSEIYDNTDWAGIKSASAMTWSSVPFATNPDRSNALRWGTMYSFRFDSAQAPVTGTATIGLFRAGTPASVSTAVQVPGSCAAVCGTADFDGDGDNGTDADIESFFACLAGTCCPTCFTADFDGDGDAGTDSDIEAFFRVLAGGSC